MRRRPDILDSLRMLGIGIAILHGSILAPTVGAEPARGGGFVPTPRKTREELVREWDLNSDGKIDAGEMEVAASRMRRERAELRLNSGIDPVTGLPRGEAMGDEEPADPDAAAAEPDPQQAAEDEKAAADDASKRIPGTSVPRPTVPRAGHPNAPDTKAAKDTKDGAPPAASAAKPGFAGTRAAADQKRQPITGGVRGGGMPARAGYGAGVPAAPLNAGLPIVPKPGPAATLGKQSPARGGLVPVPRQPPPAAPPRPTASRDLYDPY